MKPVPIETFLLRYPTVVRTSKQRIMHGRVLSNLNGPFALVTWYKIHHTGWQKNAVDSNTKEFQPVKLDFAWFSMSQWRMPGIFAIQYGGF